MFNALRGVLGRGRNETPAKAQKSTQFNPYYYGNSFDGLTGRNRSFTADKWGAAQATINIAYVMAIIKKLVGEFEAINYRIVDEQGETVASRDDMGNDPLMLALDDYAQRSNGFGLFAYWALHKFVTGEAYIELIRNDYGYPRGLGAFNSLYMMPEYNADGSINFYRYGSTYKVDPRRVVIDRFRENLFTETEGTPPLLAALNGGQLSTLRSAGMAQLSYFENDGLPRAIVTPLENQGMWNDNEQDAIGRALSRNKGAGGKYQTQIFPYPINVDIFDTPEMQQWVESISEAKKDVFAAYGVPPSVVGLSFDTRYQVSEQDPANFKRTMAMYMRQVSAVVNTALLPFFNYPDGLTFQFDLSPYEVISQENVDRANMAYMQGAISLNEYRATIGYTEIEGADEVYMLPVGSQIITREQMLSGSLPMPMIEDAQPMLTAPIRSAEPDKINTALTDAIQKELKAWRKVARKSSDRALDFTCEYIPAWLEHHIKSALQGGMELDEIFTIDSDMLRGDVHQVASVWERLGLIDLMAGDEDEND